MVKLYFICVAVYYLFGYLFLPERICATGAYILGAFLFPLIVPVIILAAEKLTGAGRETRTRRSEDRDARRDERKDAQSGVHDSARGTAWSSKRGTAWSYNDRSSARSYSGGVRSHGGKTHSRYGAWVDDDGNTWVDDDGGAAQEYGGTAHRRYTRDFEYRLLRARTEALEVEEYLDDAHTAAIIHNRESGGRYRVTEHSCECEDFKKRHAPCKHILFLALRTERYLQYEVEPPEFFYPNYSNRNSEGKAVPCYWDFYGKKPQWLGYTNLRLYRVSGREYGVSEKTGRATNRKKVIHVNATDESDALKAAEEAGVSPPYEAVELIDLCPTYPQYQYLHAAGIPVPHFVSVDDVSALLTRYEDGNDEICPAYLFTLATKCRVRVSYFQSPRSVKSAIWSDTPDARKPAMFCYAVYCAESGFDLGQAPLESDAAVFAGFQPTEKERRYILGIQEFGWRALRTNALAYKSAAAFLKEHGAL